MKWSGRRQSGNIDDQRGSSGGSGSGGGRLPSWLFTKGGLIVVVVIVGISWLSGNNPLALLERTGIGNGGPQQTYTPIAEEEELAQFVVLFWLIPKTCGMI